MNLVEYGVILQLELDGNTVKLINMLLLKKSYVNISMLNFILTIIAVLITAGLALMISDKQKTGKKLLAAGSTIGVFYALGTTVYWFLNFIIAVVIMYFYVNSKDIDETLLKTLVLTTTIGLLGWWRQSHKEGFYVSPVRYVSPSLTAKQCQDACEGTLGCKYAQVPLATSKTGGRYKCWNSYGFNQRTWGSEKQGGDTWRNKKWRPPVTLPVSGNYYQGPIQTTGSRPDYRLIRYEMIGGNGIIPEEVFLHVDMRDQGWGNPTWGVYVEGYDKNNRSVFSRVLKAPRTSRNVSYPIYTNRPYSYRYCYTYPVCRWSWNRRNWWNIFRWYSCRASRRCITKRGTRRVLSRYGSRMVQGPVSHQSKTWQLSGAERRAIKSIRCFVKTRGQGHSLKAQAIRWHVKGWPV